MNSLPVKILTAILTFAIGVGVASLWLTSRRVEPVMEPVPTGTAANRLEMVFVLDTTGSMGGLLDGAKQRIWGIVNDVMQESHASVKIGLVAYRDHGDEYVTQVLPLTEDLDKVYTTLMDYKAAGGGDGPEDVRTALAEGLYKAGWSAASPDLAQIIFLVGDAPPHNDYHDEQDTQTTAMKAVQKGIIVNTIQCGISGETARAWQTIADFGHGEYFAIPADGGVQAITTPYDEQLGDLATRLGQTFTAYGYAGEADAEMKRGAVARQAAAIEARVATAASLGAKAERAINKVANSEAYVGDLLQNIENGTVKLDAIDPASLPESLQSMSPAERKQEIERRLAERQEIRSQISALSKQRIDFIAAEQKKSGSKEAGFDIVVSKEVQKQIKRMKF
jgi:uncharacterized protein YegL